MRTRRWGIVLILTVVMNTSVPAATSAEPLPLRAGDRLRIKTFRGPTTWLTGTVVVTDSTSLRLLIGQTVVGIGEDEITAVQISRGVENGAGKAALIGGAVGAAALGLPAAWADNGREVVTNLAFVGFALGGLIGYVIGSGGSTDDWQDVESFQIGAVTSPNQSPGLAIALGF